MSFQVGNTMIFQVGKYKNVSCYEVPGRVCK